MVFNYAYRKVVKRLLQIPERTYLYGVKVPTINKLYYKLGSRNWVCGEKQESGLRCLLKYGSENHTTCYLADDTTAAFQICVQ